KNDKINSFGANIHDLLADEFFMKNNIGEFASSKIMDIYDMLQKTEPNDSDLKKYEELKIYISLIGEKVLQKPLLELLEKKYQKMLSKQEQIKYHQEPTKKLMTGNE